MTWNPEQRANETRYGENNPPHDQETAERRVNELREHISHINIDLEEREVESFPNEVAYEGWRKRALAALVYIKVEARFLEKWIQTQKRDCALQTITTHVVRLVSDAQTRTNELRHQPTNLEEAKWRIKALTQLRDEINAEFVQLMELGKTEGLSKREVANQLSSLRTLVEAIEGERRSTRGYFQANDPDSIAVAKEPLPAPAQEIMNFAQMSAAALSQERPEISGPNNAPADLDEMMRRRAMTADLRSKVGQALQTVGEMWRDHPYAGGTLKEVNRPLAALYVSLEEEACYLNNCAEEVRRRAKEKKDNELHQIKQGIQKRAEELAAEINSSYTALYTAESSPANPDEARQRLAIIPGMKRRVQAACAEITNAWCQHPLNRKDLSGVKRPLVAILDAIEVENEVAKKFIGFHQTQQPLMGGKKFRWKSICVAALTRAAFEGFRLTDDEREVIQALIADLEVSNKP